MHRLPKNNERKQQWLANIGRNDIDIKVIEKNIVLFEPEHESNNNIQLDNIELNLLYNIAGYIITSISKCTRICSECINSAGSKRYDPKQQYPKLVQLRSFRKNTLFFVNNETFTYFYNMEIIIRQYLPHAKQNLCNFVTFYMDKMKILTYPIKSCHNLPYKIMKRFIVYRMRISCRKGRLKQKEYSSKTMAMHSVFQ
jgi:hypothetical protein